MMPIYVKFISAKKTEKVDAVEIKIFGLSWDR